MNKAGQIDRCIWGINRGAEMEKEERRQEAKHTWGTGTCSWRIGRTEVRDRQGTDEERTEQAQTEREKRNRKPGIWTSWKSVSEVKITNEIVCGKTPAFGRSIL